MKEVRFFYQPEPQICELQGDEAQHATRVLRLTMGDELLLVDGRGSFYNAVITEATNHKCRYRITGTKSADQEWLGRIHIALAPTKNLDRIEWFVEKVTEIGVDRISLLDCRFSERRVVKTERLDRILVSAMKQSHKAWKPELDEMIPFDRFVRRTDLPDQRFIAHCYDMDDVAVDEKVKSFLFNVMKSQTDTLLLIGPEGDFSIDEVRLAHECGFRSVSLGRSRLRTETAALAGVHIMRIRNGLEVQ